MIILFSLNSCELKLFLILADIVITFSDYKAKIGFTGQLLIEPKPKEPTKHQYDYGKCATILTTELLSIDQQLSQPMNGFWRKSTLGILVEGKHFVKDISLLQSGFFFYKSVIDEF